MESKVIVGDETQRNCEKIKIQLDHAMHDNESLSQEIHDLKESNAFLKIQNQRLEKGYQRMEDQVYTLKNHMMSGAKELKELESTLQKLTDHLISANLSRDQCVDER